MCKSKVDDIRYVYKSCSETNLYEPCFTMYRDGQTLKWCSMHKFLRVPANDDVDSQKQISSALESALEQWLVGISSRYALIP